MKVGNNHPGIQSTGNMCEPTETPSFKRHERCDSSNRSLRLRHRHPRLTKCLDANGHKLETLPAPQHLSSGETSRFVVKRPQLRCLNDTLRCNFEFSGLKVPHHQFTSIRPSLRNTGNLKDLGLSHVHVGNVCDGMQRNTMFSFHLDECVIMQIVQLE